AEALFNDSAGHPRPHVLTWAEMKEVHGLRYEGVARFYSRARAALAALEAHAAVAPKEPTPAMEAYGKERGDIALERSGPDPEDVDLRPGGASSIWRAMLEANPFAPEKEARDE